MRIYIDGPKLEKFCARKVVKGRPEFTGSSLCKRSQAQYRKRYGAKALKKRTRSKAADEAEDEAYIPSRKDKGKLRKDHPDRIGKYLKDKKMQAKEMPKNAVSCVDELIMRKLKEEESTVGPSEAQLEAKKKATANLEKKRKFISEMVKPKSDFLDEKNEQEVKKHKKIERDSNFHLASLHDNALQKRFLAAEECKMFGARKKDFDQDIPGDWEKDECKSLSVECCFKKFLRRSPEKKKLWFSEHTSLLRNPDWRQELVDQKVLINDMAFLGAVVFGGYLVDEHWVKKSRKQGLLEKGLLLEPVWKLAGSMKKALELYLDKSLVVEGDLLKECKLLYEAKPDNVLVQEVGDPDDAAVLVQEAASSCWIWHTERSEIRRKKGSWVVCKDQDRVEELTKKKEEMEEECTKLKENVAELQQKCESAVGANLLRQKKELKKKQGELKEKNKVLAQKKGVPIPLPKFLEEVVLPQCHLVPLRRVED